MIDLDLLREINNTYGHLAGDAVLERVADVFRSNLRADDIAARFGGEEFVLLLPDTELAAALALAERMRETIGTQKSPWARSGRRCRPRCRSASPCTRATGRDTSSLIHRADLAVYRAKIQGRNRVVDGRVEPLGELRPTRSGGARSRRSSTPTDHPHEAASCGRGDRDVRRWSTSSTQSAAPMPQHRPAGVTRRHCAHSPRRRGDLHRATHRPRRAVRARRPRRRRPGARAPGRGRRRVSVGAVGALAGAALIGGGAAVVLALAAVVVDAIMRRPPIYTSIYNLGVLTAAGSSPRPWCSASGPGNVAMLESVVFGVVAGAVYFGVNTILLALAIAVEEGEPMLRCLEAELRLAAAALPRLRAVPVPSSQSPTSRCTSTRSPSSSSRSSSCARRRSASLASVRESESRLQDAASTIHRQNVSLEDANRLAADPFDRGARGSVGDRRRPGRLHRRALAARP